MREAKLNVGIVMGGKSVEHDISILTGLQAYHAIDKEKYNVTCFYINKNNEWLVGNALNDINTYIEGDFSKCHQVTLFGQNNKSYYKGIFTRPRATIIDVFVLALHGEGAEDGTITGFLDSINAIYTSSNTLASAILQDKVLTKELLQSKTVEMVPYTYATDLQDDVLKRIKTMNYPLILKSARLGSSIGVFVVEKEEDFTKAFLEAKKYGNKVLIEEKLQNFKEYNIALIKDGSKIILSQIEEVIPSHKILSFKDKYEEDIKLSNFSNRIIPAVLNSELKQEIENVALTIYKHFLASGVIRIDFLYDQNTKKLYFNEVNTIPGSFAFYLFSKLQISFTKLIDILIKNAILEKTKESKYLKTFPSNVLSKKGLKIK